MNAQSNQFNAPGFLRLDAFLAIDTEPVDIEEWYAEVTEIYSQFEDEDAEALRAVWRERPDDWIANFHMSLPHINWFWDEGRFVPTRANYLPLAWEMIGSDSDLRFETGLELLRQASIVCIKKGQNLSFEPRIQIGPKQLAFLAERWKASPKLRDRIKYIAIEAEKAGELRRILGLAEWSEAKEKYPAI